MNISLRISEKLSAFIFPYLGTHGVFDCICLLGRFWSDSVDAQAYLSLPCFHLQEGTISGDANHVWITVIWLSFGTPTTINCPFGTHGKFIIFIAPIFKYITVFLKQSK